MKIQTAEQEKKAVNGFQPEGIHEVIDHIRKEPALGAAKFRLKNRWMGADANRSTVGGFYAGGEERQHKAAFQFDNGEPPVLLGRDNGANPVEFLLHALAGCVTTTTVMHAAARKIAIEKLETSLEGDLDIRGLLGIAPHVPVGYQNIRVVMDIATDVREDDASVLRQLYKYSPVLNSIMCPVAVTVRINGKYTEKE